jgi:hypothetical protein
LTKKEIEDGNKEKHKQASSGGAAKPKGRSLDDSCAIKVGGIGVGQSR